MTVPSPFPIAIASPNSAFGTYDAFGRYRVSDPFSIFDNKQLFDSNPLIWDTAATGTGAIAYQTNKSSTLLSVTGGGVGTVARQTFRKMAYQPGKSQNISMTGILVAEGGTGIANVTRRIGAFDANNGLFFQLSGTGG